MSNTELKKKLLPVLERLSQTVLLDNDGEVIFYGTTDYIDLIDDLIESGQMSRVGFNIMLFNFIEAPNDKIGIDRIMIQYKDMASYDEIPEEGLSPEDRWSKEA